jgi:predicted Zn finger-like uncharacterized protein
MDVRCDRCQTEYELEDQTIGEQGASVQCTTCGHTFVVSRSQRMAAFTPTPSPAPAADSGSVGGTWVLTTEEGRTHRFRDPTTLQKWIVERRVGRNDKVTAPGAGSARRLGEVEELRPFFDVVDQADRAAARGVRATRPETPGRARPSAGRAYASPDEDDDDVLSSSQRTRGGFRASGARSRDEYDSGARTILPVRDGRTNPLAGRDDDDAMDFPSLPVRHTGRNIGIGAVLVALAGLAAYLGFKSAGLGGSHVPPSASPPVAVAPAAPLPAAPAAAPASAPAPTPAPAAAPAPTAAAPSPAAPAPVSPQVAAAPSAPAPVAAPSAPAAAPGAPAPAASAPARAPSRAATNEAPSHAHTYEQLVAEADRALGNGSTAKAEKLFAEALRLEPNGVAAVTGTAYVLLDREKPLAAIGLFKRALGIAPTFPQALFGLGEAYRAEGEPTQAVEAYKRYLAAAPGGADAPAARRQIRDLEEQLATKQHRSEATIPSATEPPPQ